MKKSDLYLLGTNENGMKVWLVKPEWACDHYWSIGQLLTFAHDWDPSIAKDFDSLTHWDSQTAEVRGDDTVWFIKTFGLPTKDLFNRENTDAGRKSNFTYDQIYHLCELMRSAYTLYHAAELLHYGHSNYCGHTASKEVIKDNHMYKKINTVMLPEIFKEIGQLFDEVYKTQTNPIIGEIPKLD
jgi:hypothetical protein